MTDRKWSWSTFIIGMLNKSFLVWIASTVFVAKVVFSANGDKALPFYIILIAGWFVLGIIYMIQSAVEEAVRNAKINANLEAKIGGMVDVKKQL